MASSNNDEYDKFSRNGEFVHSEMFKNISISNNNEIDDDYDDNREELIRNSFFRNGFQNELYQDELFGERNSEVINNSNDLTSKGEDSIDSIESVHSLDLIESINDAGMNDSQISQTQLFEGSKELDITACMKDKSVKLSDHKEMLDEEDDIEDSIFESVSVAYENRTKNLENKESKMNSKFDEKLMRELLELSIDDKQQSNQVKQHLDAPISNQAHSNRMRTQFKKSNILESSSRMTSPNSARLRESQRKLTDIVRKLGSGKSAGRQMNILSNNNSSSKSKPYHFKQSQKPQSATISRKGNHLKTQISPRPYSCSVKERKTSAKSRSASSNICITPRPAFRAGSLMDFSRKIDEDGRRMVAGKNNPYWKLRPTFSHKASHVDEMLFQQNSSTPRDFSPTWHAPWQPKSKPARPHFCDWVYDRRKPQKT